MKSSILLLAVSVAVFSSCSTSYKTGQTPDDVYFSPTRPQQDQEEVSSERYDDRYYKNNDEYYDDRYLRMKVHNRNRWSDLDDWYYYDRYSLGYNYYYGSYHNPYNSWNYYYNPYCCCHTNNIYNNPKTNIAYNKPRVFNLGSYNVNTSGNSNSNPKYRGQPTTNGNSYNSPGNSSNTGRNNNSGNILRNIFNNSSSSGSSKNNSSSGNNNNSSSNSSSSSSSGNSGSTTAPVRKF